MLPQKFVNRYLEKAEGARVFGYPLKELSREELIAMVCFYYEQEQNAIKESKRQRDFLLSLHKKY